jgi:fructose-bisphosphate aldolase class 1
MKTETLETIARKLVAPGKGILEADESSATIEKTTVKNAPLPTPWTARNAMSSLRFWLRPEAAEPIRKIVRPRR